MGLLDFLNTDEARSGINFMAAASPSMQPMGFGERLALAMRMNDEQQRRAQEEQYRKEQMRIISQKADREQKLQSFMANRFGFGGGQANQPSGMGSPGQGMSGGMPPGQQSDPMQQGQGGKFPFSLNEIGFLQSQNAPGAEKLLDLYKYSNDGSKREGGNYYVNPMNGQTTFMPKVPEGATMTQDGRIMPMPGAADTNAAYKGAETLATERAKAGLDLVDVPIQGGGARTVPRSMAASMLGGGQAPAGFGVTQSPADRTYADESAKSAAEQYKQMQNDGFSAPGKITKYKQLGELLANHDGGKLSGLGLDIAQAANSLNLKIDSNLSNKEAAKVLNSELVRVSASANGSLGAGVSNADVQFLEKSFPNIMTSKGGNRKIIDIQVKILQRQQKVAEMARQWQKRGGRIDATDPQGRSFQDMLKTWADSNPLFEQ